MAESSEENKTEEPTGKRIEDAAEKGQVAYTKEFGATLGLIGILSVIYWSSQMLYGSMTSTFRSVFSNLRPWEANQIPFMTVAYPSLRGLITAMALIFAAAYFFPLAAHIIQKGPKPRPEAAKPTFEKVDPIAGVKRLFSLETIANFAKSFIKAMGLMAIYYLTVAPYVKEIAYSASRPYENALKLYGTIVLTYLIYAIIFMVAVVAMDYTFQKLRNYKKLMMSRQEVKDEMKEMEGSPEFKRKLREVQIEKSKRQIDKQVPNSTVIVTNPTHFAVAISYQRGVTPVPKVVAKGADLLCTRIKKIAKEHKVPIVEAPPLARALYRDVKVGENIPRSFYQAVAKILGTIFKLEEEQQRQKEERARGAYLG